MDDDKRRSGLVMEVRAAYAVQQSAPRGAGRTGRDGSPQALETALSEISEEVTADAIERRRREAKEAALTARSPRARDRLAHTQLATTPSPGAVPPAAVTEGLKIAPPSRLVP